MPVRSSLFAPFPSNRLRVSGLRLRFLIHLGLSFMQSERRGSTFILCSYPVRLLLFFSWCCLFYNVYFGLFSKSDDWNMVSLYVGPEFHCSMSLFLHQYHDVSITIALWCNLKSETMIPLALSLLLSRIILAIMGPCISI